MCAWIRPSGLLLTLVFCWFLPVPNATADDLGSPRPGEGGNLTDAHGDALPAQALVRFGTIRFRHGDRVTAVAFTPDGKIVAMPGTIDSSAFGRWKVAGCSENWQATPIRSSRSPLPPTARPWSPAAGITPSACGIPPPAGRCGPSTPPTNRSRAWLLRPTARAWCPAVWTAGSACGTRPPARNCASSPGTVRTMCTPSLSHPTANSSPRGAMTRWSASGTRPRAEKSTMSPLRKRSGPPSRPQRSRLTASSWPRCRRARRSSCATRPRDRRCAALRKTTA